MARKTYKFKKGTKQAKKYGSKPASKAKITKIVKSVMSKDIERKTVVNEFSSNAAYLLAYDQTVAAVPWNFNSLFPVSPYPGYFGIAQGVGQADRVGNRITIKKATLNLMFQPLPYDLTFNSQPRPCFVKLYLFYDRLSPVNEPADLSNFFQNGNTSTSPNTLGLPVDMLKKINNDRYKVVLQRTVKLGCASYTGTGTSAVNQSYANNDFSLCPIMKIDYTKHLVKTVKYNDTTAIPNTRALFCAMLIMSADGSTISTQRVARYTGFMQLEYTDA